MLISNTIKTPPILGRVALSRRRRPCFMLNIHNSYYVIFFFFMFVALNRSIFYFMTSKDFSHRLQYYVSFLTAFDCFTDPSHPYFIWKITICEVMAGFSVFYSYTPYVTSSLISDFDVDTIVVERYSLLRFNLDMKYFKTFLSKLSEYQYECIKSDSRFTNILNYLSHE